jgi:hypothetical protein
MIVPVSQQLQTTESGESKTTLLLCPQLCYETTIVPPTVVLSGYYECFCQPAAPDHTESGWKQDSTAMVSPTSVISYYSNIVIL